MRKGFDYVGIGIGAAIIRDGKLFLAKRGEKAKNERGNWETPGGGLEQWETMEETVKREFLEEYDAEIEIVEELIAKDHILRNEGQHWVAICFLARLVGNEPRIMEPEKCAEIGWFTLDEAEKLPLTIPAAVDVKKLRKMYPNGLPQTI